MLLLPTTIRHRSPRLFLRYSYWIFNRRGAKFCILLLFWDQIVCLHNNLRETVGVFDWMNAPWLMVDVSRLKNTTWEKHKNLLFFTEAVSRVVFHPRSEQKEFSIPPSGWKSRWGKRQLNWQNPCASGAVFQKKVIIKSQARFKTENETKRNCNIRQACSIRHTHIHIHIDNDTRL